MKTCSIDINEANCTIFVLNTSQLTVNNVLIKDFIINYFNNVKDVAKFSKSKRVCFKTVMLSQKVYLKRPLQL